MAGRNVTFTFDSGIEKIMWGGINTASDLTNEIAASPSTVFFGSQDVYAKPALKSGYVIDTVTGAEARGDGIYHINAFTTSSVTFTSKVSEDSSTKSYDLSTSTKWGSLSAGNHSVTIVAKASGYRDSTQSTAVTVVKSSASETWLLNETPSTATSTGATISTNINFVSNGVNYTLIEVGKKERIYYDSTAVFDGMDNTWADVAYRTLTFATAPTGDLLTWLQANGTKQ